MLKGKTALVTGSTSGIGQAIAERLAAAGCNVMLNGFGDAAEIEALRGGLAASAGVDVGYSGADMSKPDQIADLVEETAASLGGPDIVVNNAGIQYVAPIEEFPAARWEAIIAINLSAAFYSTAAVLPKMRGAGWGRIVNIASAHGLRASAGKAAYVAAKHGIVGLTKVTALETAEDPITCNAVCPGWVLTPLVQKQIDARAAEQGCSGDEAARQLLAEKQPSMEFATPAQIAGTVAFLCSADAEQITGTTISVDGGWTAR